MKDMTFERAHNLCDTCKPPEGRSVEDSIVVDLARGSAFDCAARDFPVLESHVAPSIALGGPIEALKGRTHSGVLKRPVRREHHSP